MPATATRTASYKGRTYRALFIGQTKYGRRAHLQFMDGTKDFWVDAGLVTERTGDSDGQADEVVRHNTRHVCAECGRGGPLVSDLEDGLMKHYSCCDIPPSGY